MLFTRESRHTVHSTTVVHSVSFHFCMLWDSFSAIRHCMIFYIAHRPMLYTFCYIGFTPITPSEIGRRKCFLCWGRSYGPSMQIGSYAFCCCIYKNTDCIARCLRRPICVFLRAFIFSLVASSEKHSVTVWRATVCLSVSSAYSPWWRDSLTRSSMWCSSVHFGLTVFLPLPVRFWIHLWFYCSVFAVTETPGVAAVERGVITKSRRSGTSLVCRRGTARRSALRSS